MSPKLFLNLPIKSLDRTVAFFTALGFSFNKQFTDEKATCMIINDDAYAMLLVEPFFQSFTPKPIIDAHKNVEVLIALSAESREKVDEMFAKAIAAGGKEAYAAKDYGFMYGRAFEDLDGHIWEVFWMDPSHIQPT